MFPRSPRMIRQDPAQTLKRAKMGFAFIGGAAQSSCMTTRPDLISSSFRDCYLSLYHLPGPLRVGHFFLVSGRTGFPQDRRGLAVEPSCGSAGPGPALDRCRDRREAVGARRRSKANSIIPAGKSLRRDKPAGAPCSRRY